ncbi:MAG: hypothetical protein NC302_04525 [Bacteroidales bacterium]|nr:hypothetical protein [Bacteroidales bacterium]MCM1415628.1 hypothetical protein [bacterium]MCM1422948.1 hypothetical protein [bacterium]
MRKKEASAQKLYRSFDLLYNYVNHYAQMTGTERREKEERRVFGGRMRVVEKT